MLSLTLSLSFGLPNYYICQRENFAPNKYYPLNKRCGVSATFPYIMVVKIAIWIVGSHDFTILPHQNI